LVSDEVDTVRRFLKRNPDIGSRLDDPLGEFGSPLINHVRSKEMLDVLLDAGADINARSNWWAGGFGVLDGADPEVAEHAINRGATVTPHAAARLGPLERLRELIEGDPSLVHARGGDGQTPLHFASTIEIAGFLLDHGADIDALDIDHVSTPAQYMVRSRPDIARYLVARGCRTDLLMAAALGDRKLAEKLLDDDPECIRTRVSDEYFAMIGSEQGGTIYQWELGWYVSAPEVAQAFGYQQLAEYLTDRSPDDEKLLIACRRHNEELVDELQRRHPGLSAKLSPAAQRHVAHAARNNDTAAARLMIKAGFPTSGVYSQHHASPLHWAAWHGNAELTGLLLGSASIDLEDADNEFAGTPLGWAIHGSEHAWDRTNTDYRRTVELLLSAGATEPEQAEGSREVKAALLRNRG
jgi:ankyrin repeat protein